MRILENHYRFLFFSLLVIAMITSSSVMAASAPENESLKSCVGCHGQDGMGNAMFPRLAGQKRSFLESRLTQYKTGALQNALMNSAASSLSNEDIRSLAKHFSSFPIKLQIAPNQPMAKAATCSGCHGETGLGVADFPSLAGQPIKFLEDRLKQYKSGQLKNMMMTPLMASITDSEIVSLAQYFSGISVLPAVPSGTNNNANSQAADNHSAQLTFKLGTRNEPDSSGINTRIRE